MASLSDRDHEAVTAFADDELAPAARAALARRMAVDPALRAALEDVLRAKAALAQLHRAATGSEEGDVRPRGGPGWRAVAMAVAACLLVAVIGAASMVWLNREDPWTAVPATLHARLSEQTYVLAEHAERPLVASARGGLFRPLDLSASRLSLVDVAASHTAGREVIALHYRGRRGCRLSLVGVAAEPEDAAIGEAIEHDGLARVWRAAGFHFFLLADGMDAARFAAIAGYAIAATREMERQEPLVTAMDSTYRGAVPCV